MGSFKYSTLVILSENLFIIGHERINSGCKFFLSTVENETGSMTTEREWEDMSNQDVVVTRSAS